MPERRPRASDSIRPIMDTPQPSAERFFAEVLATPAAPGPCRTVDPDLFFPRYTKNADRALAVCAQCDHHRACAKIALDIPAVSGVWADVHIPDRHEGREEAMARINSIAANGAT